MKAKVVRICLIALMAAVMAGCGGLSAPSGQRCQGGICVEVTLAEPIGFNEPTGVTITVETQQDIPNLEVSLGFSDPDIVVEGERRWVVEAKAHTPIQLSTTIKFPKEGYFDVLAGALDPHRGLHVDDWVSVRITRTGGTVNPPPEREPRTPAPAERADTPESIR